MRLTILAAAACAALPWVASAQTPVPTRIAITHYGNFPSTPLAMQCDVASSWRSEIALSGGLWNDPGAILVDTRRDELPLPAPWSATLLVPPTAVALSGVFDVRGEMRFPVDLALPQLVGQTFCMQGLWLDCSGPKPVSLQASGGFELAYVAGTPQPNLAYEGVPLTAILCREDNPLLPQMYTLLARFAAPETGYEAVWDNTWTSHGVTYVDLRLIEPDPAWEGEPTTVPVRLPVDIGPVPAAVIVVRIATVPFGQVTAPVYQRAAVIDTVY